MSRFPSHNCKARVKWPYFNWGLRSCDRLPHPILAYCILVRHGVPNHVTRDHHSGVNGDGQTCGTDRDHLGPARAANRQSCGVGGSFVFVHCAIVTAVAGSITNARRLDGWCRSRCMFTHVFALVFAVRKISRESRRRPLRKRAWRETTIRRFLALQVACISRTMCNIVLCLIIVSLVWVV
jgi:hypothetical protein